ncbi:MAG TPA: Sir2 family NAD-dependent protein deacetylase [Chloroflexota bacterium]|nr:Sir2 family NAD-dependent protein deacetylase [Chloroflexota bacterium]
METDRRNAIQRAADLISRANRIVVFTGAGVSTESGIPDFRSPGGIWDRYKPVDFSEFVASKQARERYWTRSRETYPVLAAASPNPAHLAIAELERRGKLDCVITQNVDGLHQKAGNSPDRVIELHGNTHWVVCLSCAHRSPRSEWQETLKSGTLEPRCPDCGGILKVLTVSFGQAMPERETREAIRRSQLCDLFIVVGSTLVVFPAADMPLYALESGARLIVVNLTPTYVDDRADVVICDKAGPALSAIVRESE